ncbi:acylase [Phenylobacterium sp.]|uniref:acylase n=1 Tax=Phenylobacterium sp. TaxID=1871053 RepID=UPI00289A4EF4|nr:acylase [Phenylobacterium sp.]
MNKLLVGAAAWVLAAGIASSAGAATYEAQIVRTRYGIPHVTAKDFGGLGYGQAYAFAQDNLCLIADKIVTVNGERTRRFGPDATTVIAFTDIKNLESDFFFRAQDDIASLRAKLDKGPADYRALVHGYVAGFNRYLADTPKEKRPAECRDAAWVRPIGVDDMLRLNEERMIQASGGAWLRQTNAAAPPSAAAPAKAAANVGLPDMAEQIGLGSNGWAFGRDATTNRSGLLLGNPHFPWETTNRFYELHLTIPGKFDAMGVTIAGAPGLSIGFNKDVAWTHTVSTDRHFTLFELALDPADPTAYLVDGKRHVMDRRTVTVDTAAGPQTRTYYATVYGPVVVMPQAGLAWTDKTAYALRDANKGNSAAAGTWLDISRAKSVGEIKDLITTSLGIPWVNTIAADRHGDALYADITATPNVSAEKLQACAPSPAAARLADASRVYVLDGSRSACDWDAPGLMPGATMPAVIRTDYVANSNDSFWLANAKAPLPAHSPIVGLVDTPQNLRTRSGVVEIDARLAGTDGLPGKGFDQDAVKTMLFWNKNHAAELYLDDTLKACEGGGATAAEGKSVDLGPACAILAKWDRRMDNDSVGALLWMEYWRQAQKIADLYVTPFSAADPINTPRGLKTAPDTAAKLRQALAGAVELMAAQNIPLDAPYGAHHFTIRGQDKIPVHGGEGSDGVLNAQQARFDAKAGGYVPYHGSSYIQVVTFDDKGPVADAVLSYSQSTDPASPHYADQTWLYSKKGWHRLPFHGADIAADAPSAPLVLKGN